MGLYIYYKSLKRKREKGVENLYKEIMAEKLPNLGKEIDILVQEA